MKYDCVDFALWLSSGWTDSSNMATSERELINLLALQPHPEGGFYAESFRSPRQLNFPEGRIRSACSVIFFLLPSGDFSALHRVDSDETWNYYDGAPLEMTILHPSGEIKTVILGRNLSAGERFHHVVPAGHWQGARPTGSGYSLVGCTVAPGFDFADFEMPDRDTLLRLFPQNREAILALTRE